MMRLHKAMGREPREDTEGIMLALEARIPQYSYTRRLQKAMGEGLEQMVARRLDAAKQELRQEVEQQVKVGSSTSCTS